MKNFNLKSSVLKFAVLPLLVLGVGCTMENESLDADLFENESTSSQEGDSVNITNPGFEDSKNGWSGSFAISGDEYSGSSSGKLSSSSKSISQTVSVSSNTNYILSAYILGGGTLGATANGSDTEKSGDYSSWTKVSVSFNSGSSTSITIYGDYNSDEGRFDDFELIEGAGSSSSSGRFPEMVGKTVRIENVASDLWLRITGTSDFAQAEVVAQTNTGTWPRWVVEEVFDNDKYYYRFKNVASNRRFRPQTSTSGTDIYMGKTSWVGNWTQWEVSSDGNGNYIFKNRTTSDYLNAGENSNGDIAKATASTSGNLTTWRIEDLNGNDANGQTVVPPTVDPPTVDPPTGGGDVESILGDFWKITVPVDEDGNATSRSCSEYDCRNNDAADLYGLNDVAANSDYSEYFYESNGWVVFRAFCGGATTENSQYPRTELRGLDEDGDDSYFSMNNHQELEVTVKVLEVPIERPEVNMVQIHGPDNEPLRVEYNTGDIGLHLTVNENDDDHEDIMDYEIGDRLKVWVKVDDGHLWLELTNLDKSGSRSTYETDYDIDDATGYWKVGCYLQGSTSYCDVKSGDSFCKNGGESDDYDTTGAVAVTNLSLIRDGKTYK